MKLRYFFAQTNNLDALTVKHLLKEPLLHFALAGALLFGLSSWLAPSNPGSGAGARQVRIGEGEVKWLVET